MEYLEDLNEAQREAVVNTAGPSMIIAGAGSGKTRVLTYRIAHLIKSGQADPFNILSLTFTNKASREMKSRIESVVGSDAKNLWTGTFHSVFARILRAEAGHIGYPSNFTIYDTEDSKTLIRNIVKEMSLDDKLYKANLILNRISSAKNRLISADDYLNNPTFMADDASALRPKIGEIFKTYQLRCFKSSAMDFDDLLYNTNILFRDHVDVLNKYQQRFHYVMVDEFQDTNYSQYLITRKLSAVRQNICVVGDDAQSIYAFRGADIQNILNYEKDYPDLKVYKLEQNYRSTQNIVNAANSVIEKNRSQLKKSVWTSNDEGEQIELIKATSDNEEGKLVASSIFEQKANFQSSWNDFAILYRTNSQSRAMEEALRKMNIKYRIVGGLSFYQRREIKDLVAYLRYVINPNDEQAFRRIINLPKRGIGSTTVEKIRVTAEENGITLWDVVQNAPHFLSGRATTTVDSFATLIKGFMLDLKQKDAYEVAANIAKQSGILRELYEDKTIEGLNRYENVQELLNAVREFVDERSKEPGPDGTIDVSLGAFLQEIALLTDADKAEDNDAEKVTLMTIHSAKGLEFKTVYIVGLEEDLFPSQMMLSSRAELEEERRLFYVAITRAERKLFFAYALTRYRFGRLKNCEPSRFLEEVDPRFIKLSKKFSVPVTNSKPNGYDRNSYSKNFVKSVRSTQTSRPVKNHTPSPDFKPSDTSNLGEGMKVEHPKFGFGVVTTIDDQGSGRKAKVAFDNFGEKTLLLSFAKLKILEANQ